MKLCEKKHNYWYAPCGDLVCDCYYWEKAKELGRKFFKLKPDEKI